MKNGQEICDGQENIFQIIFKSICIFYSKTCIKSLVSFFPIVIAGQKYLKLMVGQEQSKSLMIAIFTIKIPQNNNTTYNPYAHTKKTLRTFIYRIYFCNYIKEVN